jgi:hypothetical protein
VEAIGRDLVPPPRPDPRSRRRSQPRHHAPGSPRRRPQLNRAVAALGGLGDRCLCGWGLPELRDGRGGWSQRDGEAVRTGGEWCVALHGRQPTALDVSCRPARINPLLFSLSSTNNVLVHSRQGEREYVICIFSFLQCIFIPGGSTNQPTLPVRTSIFKKTEGVQIVQFTDRRSCCSPPGYLFSDEEDSNDLLGLMFVKNS